MTAPKTCDYCGAALDAGEVCDCRETEHAELIRVTQLPVIEEHLRSLKASVEERTAQAMSLVCSDETLTAVKSMRAALNRDFTEYENQRKAVKAAIMAPYEQFEAVYRDCVAEPFRRADEHLRGKIGAVEQDLKAACEAGLREYFAELCAAEHLDWLTFEQTGVRVDMASARAKTPKKLREQLATIVAKVAKRVDMISGMENADEIMVEFKQTLDLPVAVGTVQERHRRMGAEKAAQEARKAAQEREEEAVAKVEATAPPTVQEPPKAPEQVHVFRCTFTVTATKPQLVKLKEFLLKEGIQYE